MEWFGDYHLNYNVEGPFYALASSNHTELTDCYLAPLYDFMPHARQYARDFLGCRGLYFPVNLGPLGFESDGRRDTKEHGRLFLGQKTNGTYAAVIPMMRWYATRDTEYAKEAYPFVRACAEFWEDYLSFKDGKYHTDFDTLNEVAWWSGPDYMPEELFNDADCILSLGLVRMLMKLVVDMARALGVDGECIPKWEHIAGRFGPAETVPDPADGKPVLSATSNRPGLRALCLRYMYPAEQIGFYSTPELYEAARNSLEKLSSWDDDNLFCEFYPTAARLGYDPKRLIAHMHDVIRVRGLPNGMIRYGGGGIENCASVPGTVNEMLLQSYEHVLRLFPNWDRDQDASFTRLRAYGAFVVSGEIRGGEIRAEIVSEKGSLLRLEKPGEGYAAAYRGEVRPLTETITEFETAPGETLSVYRA
jgi:hypothetical protein